MHLAKDGRAVATRVPAAAVPSDHCPPLRTGVRALGSPHVQRLAVRPEDDPGDLAVAGDAREHRRGDGVTAVQLGRRQVRLGTERAPGGDVPIPQRLERLPAHVHADVRAHLGPASGQPSVQHQPGELGQCVRASLVGSPGVIGRRDSDDPPQRGRQYVPVLEGEEPLDGHAVVPRAENQPFSANRVLVLALVGGSVDASGPALDLTIKGVRPHLPGLLHQRSLVQVGRVRGEGRTTGLARRGQPGEDMSVLERDLARRDGSGRGGQVAAQRLAQRGLAPCGAHRRPGPLRRPLRERPGAAEGPASVLLHSGEEPGGEGERLVRARADLPMHLGGLRAVELADGTSREGGHGGVQASQVGGPTLRNRHPAPPASKAVCAPHVAVVPLELVYESPPTRTFRARRSWGRPRRRGPGGTARATGKDAVPTRATRDDAGDPGNDAGDPGNGAGGETATAPED